MRNAKITLLILFLVSFNLIQGQNNHRDIQKELKLDKQLESIDPSLVETFNAGTKAMDANNPALADSLFTIVYLKAPAFDPVLRRLGTVRIDQGKTIEGITLCKKAVEINKSAFNILSLAYCYMVDKDSANLSKALTLLKNAEQLPDGNDISILSYLAQVSLQQDQIIEVRQAVDKMKRLYPGDMLTLYYSAMLSANDKKWFRAKKEILLAQKAGLPADTVDQFLNSGVNSEILQLKIEIYFAVIVGAWILGLLLLFLVGKLFSSLTLKSIGMQALQPMDGKSGGWLRSGYKFLINAGGVYYYLSLPIILILVVALVIGIFYLFLVMGRMPVQLMLILILGSAGTIYNMVRSLLVKVTYTDPGRELVNDEAPGLYALTGQVAQVMGTRPIDEIRITHGTDLAVYEKGTRSEKQHDRARRILILGTGILKDFKQNDFKAVIAHEYGHFSHRDTAGGEVALRVQNDMNKYVYALYMANQATLWNIAFQFLRLYSFIFRRISHGSTRLQEVLADRVAARTFGTTAFENGLTYVIKREIEFHSFANTEIKEAVESKRPLNNLYELSSQRIGSFDEELNKAIHQKTTENDTHPSPADRFRFIAGINTLSAYQDSALVTELFTNWEAITDEMTKKIEVNVDRDEY
ncbi:MAG: M48 family metallopeptidase [Paludibacter sp.]|nr:M48 family metallopeptidase [Paludibacter sp.]